MSFDDREEREFMESAWIAALDVTEVKVMEVTVRGVKGMGVTHVS
jgi:hypothetical protein